MPGHVVGHCQRACRRTPPSRTRRRGVWAAPTAQLSFPRCFTPLSFSPSTPTPPSLPPSPRHLAASEGAYGVTEWLLGEGVNVNALDRFKRTPLEDAVRGEFKLEASLLVKAGGLVYSNGKVCHLFEEHFGGERKREGGAWRVGLVCARDRALILAGRARLIVGARRRVFSALPPASSIRFLNQPPPRHIFRPSQQLVPMEESELVSTLGYKPPPLLATQISQDWELDPSSIHIKQKLGEGEFGVVHRATWCASLDCLVFLGGWSGEGPAAGGRGQRRGGGRAAVCRGINMPTLCAGGALVDGFGRTQRDGS